MAGKQHDLPFCDLFLYHILQQHCIDRVKAGERLIQNHNVRIVRKGCNELDFLLISL